MTAGSSALILVLVSAVLSVASYNIVHTRLKKSRLKMQVTAHFESVGDLASPSTTVDTQVLDAAAANVVLRATATALQGLVPSANDEDEDEIQVDHEFPRSAASASEENPLYRSSGSASIPDQRQPPESVRANRQSRGVPVGQSNSGHTGIFQSQKGQSPVSKGTTTVRKLPTVTVPPSRKKVQQRTYDLSTTEALARHKRGMAGEQGSRVSDLDFVRLDTHDIIELLETMGFGVLPESYAKDTMKLFDKGCNGWIDEMEFEKLAAFVATTHNGVTEQTKTNPL